MIVWTGRGILAVLVLIASFAILTLIVPKELTDVVFVGSFLITAAFSWYFGKKWNGGEGHLVIDKETGQEFSLKSNHGLFWINLEYWGIIFAVFALIIMVQKFI